MSKRLDTKRQQELEPKRTMFAIKELNKLGIVGLVDYGKSIQFQHKGETVTLFPYSGWHTGKTIKDGRGINNLLKQLK